MPSVKNFSTARQPWISRQSYARELVTASTFPTAVAMLESGVIGVLAKKTFQVSEIELATIMAAPIFANLTSFLWASLSRGRRKIPFIVGLQAAVLLILIGITFLPTVHPVPWLLAITVILARCALAGMVTLRSVVWRQNYPQAQRARITGRFTFMATLIMATGPLIGFFVQDIAPESFRWFYRAVALVAAVGVVSFSRIRLRGEKQLIKYERQPTAKPKPHGDPGHVYAFEPGEEPLQRHSVWTVLLKDHDYRSYMVWMFFGGDGEPAGQLRVDPNRDRADQRQAVRVRHQHFVNDDHPDDAGGDDDPVLGKLPGQGAHHALPQPTEFVVDRGADR